MAADYRERVARRYEKAAAKLAANGNTSEPKSAGNGPGRCVGSVTSFCPPVGVPGPRMACSARSSALGSRSNSACFVPRPRPTHKRRTCSATSVSCVSGKPVPASCRRFGDQQRLASARPGHCGVASGFQFRISVIGAAALSDTVSMRKRPSGATSYSRPAAEFKPPPTIRV